MSQPYYMGFIYYIRGPQIRGPAPVLGMQKLGRTNKLSLIPMQAAHKTPVYRKTSTGNQSLVPKSLGAAVLHHQTNKPDELNAICGHISCALCLDKIGIRILICDLFPFLFFAMQWNVGNTLPKGIKDTRKEPNRTKYSVGGEADKRNSSFRCH